MPVDTLRHYCMIVSTSLDDLGNIIKVFPETELSKHREEVTYTLAPITAASATSG